MQSNSLFSCAQVSCREVWVSSLIWLSWHEADFLLPELGDFIVCCCSIAGTQSMTSDHFVLCRGSCTFQGNEMWI
jgi:hypothetical protein